MPAKRTTKARPTQTLTQREGRFLCWEFANLQMRKMVIWDNIRQHKPTTRRHSFSLTSGYQAVHGRDLISKDAVINLHRIHTHQVLWFVVLTGRRHWHEDYEWEKKLFKKNVIRIRNLKGYAKELQINYKLKTNNKNNSGLIFSLVCVLPLEASIYYYTAKASNWIFDKKKSFILTGNDYTVSYSALMKSAKMLCSEILNYLNMKQPPKRRTHLGCQMVKTLVSVGWLSRRTAIQWHLIWVNASLFIVLKPRCCIITNVWLLPNSAWCNFFFSVLLFPLSLPTIILSGFCSLSLSFSHS